MRISSLERDVTHNGVGEISDFKIKNSGKAFKVLIDGLYSDKERAVVREIWSNAYDAHIAAGQDRPFECQLPTVWDPTFRVRDFGTGMDHNTVMHLYTTVFESSKEDSDTEVGKFGLGSKSPFAYTDTFNITCYDGTEKRLYTAFIGPGYRPQCGLMAVEPCTEPRGVEITFPVKSDDVKAFETAAQTTILGFNPHPIVTPELHVPDIESRISGDGWVFVKNQWAVGMTGSAMARQGCVVYPIDPDAVGGWSPIERAVLESSFLIDFKIGELEISASRESLAYDAPTKAAISARIASIADDVIGLFQAEIDQCPTYWEACKKFKELTSGEVSRAIVAILQKGLKYRGKVCNQSVNLADFLQRFSNINLEDGGLRAMKIGYHNLSQGQHYGRRTKLQFEPNYFINVLPGEFYLILDDVDAPGSMFQDRMRHWWDNLPTDGKNKPVVVVKAKRTSLAWKRLLVLMGRPQSYLVLGELPRSPKSLSKTSRTMTKCKVWEKNKWVDSEIYNTDTVVYVNLFRNEVIDQNGKEVSKYRARDLFDTLKQMGRIPAGTQFFGIPKTHEGKITKNPTWTCLWDIGAKALEELWDLAKVENAWAASNKLREATTSAEFARRVIDCGDASKIHKDSPAGGLIAIWQRLMDEAARTKEYTILCTLYRNYHDSFPDLNGKTEDTTFVHNVFRSNYPLVDYVLTKQDVDSENYPYLLENVILVDTSMGFKDDEVNENDAEDMQDAA